MANTGIQATPKGLMTALLAFLMWGNFPFYFKLLDGYHAVKVIVHRVVWTFVVLTLVVIIGKRTAWLDLCVGSLDWHKLANLCVGGGK